MKVLDFLNDLDEWPDNCVSICQDSDGHLNFLSSVNELGTWIADHNPHHTTIITHKKWQDLKIDKVASDLISELDIYSRGVDRYDYGLPDYEPHLKQLMGIVRTHFDLIRGLK